ncbi:hypothetical protein ACFQV2_16885 [Actinokineospora soli]|uniref:YtkA-like n=1 Tax=Actinokineospora soli TaxID=1048753 RepID=A0ABW2TPT6_9PSEU
MKALAVVAALFAVAVVGWLVWPTDSAPTVLHASTGTHAVRLELAEPKTGVAGVRLEVTGPEPDAVTVEPVMPQMGHVIPPVPATRDGAGYRADVPLTMGGQWVITVTLHGPTGTEDVDFPLLVNG